MSCGPPITGRLDHSKVAAVGHLLGGQTVGMLLGARLNDPTDENATDVNMFEPRVKVGVLLAAPRNGGQDLSAFAAEHYSALTPDFSRITTRALVVAGEYDANKSAENKQKHGIDFEEAQELWTDADLVEIPAWQIMKANTFDRKFDAGEQILDQLALGKARRAGTDAKRVNVDFPAWMIGSLDREVRRVGVTRQSLIKLWLAERVRA